MYFNIMVARRRGQFEEREERDRSRQSAGSVDAGLKGPRTTLAKTRLISRERERKKDEK